MNEDQYVLSGNKPVSCLCTFFRSLTYTLHLHSPSRHCIGIYLSWYVCMYVYSQSLASLARRFVFLPFCCIVIHLYKTLYEHPLGLWMLPFILPPSRGKSYMYICIPMSFLYQYHTLHIYLFICWTWGTLRSYR